jgi:hypothetical protein
MIHDPEDDYCRERLDAEHETRREREADEGDRLLDAKRDGEPWAQALEAEAEPPLRPHRSGIGNPFRAGNERRATATLDWWAQFRNAMSDQLAGDRVVEDAGYAAMLAGWTPQRFAAECATRLQESLNRRPVRVL